MDGSLLSPVFHILSVKSPTWGKSARSVWWQKLETTTLVPSEYIPVTLCRISQSRIRTRERGGGFTTKDIEDHYCCGVFWVAIILLQMGLLKIVLFWDSSVHSPHAWWVGCFLLLTIMISHQKNRIWWILCWSHDDAWLNSMEFSSLPAPLNSCCALVHKPPTWVYSIILTSVSVDDRLSLWCCSGFCCHSLV